MPTTQGLLLAFTQSSEFLCGIGFVIIEKNTGCFFFLHVGIGTFKIIFNIINTSIMWKKWFHDLIQIFIDEKHLVGCDGLKLMDEVEFLALVREYFFYLKI